MISRIEDMNITFSQVVGDIDMEIIAITKSIIILICNHARENWGAIRDLRVLRKLVRKN